MKGKDEIIRYVEEKLIKKNDLPKFGPGDTINVKYKIIEGNKERIQSFKGVVLQIKGKGLNKTFTVRKISYGVGVERIFPLYSPMIDSIEIIRKGKVRRARIYYIRNLKGKNIKIKEKFIQLISDTKENVNPTT